MFLHAARKASLTVEQFKVSLWEGKVFSVVVCLLLICWTRLCWCCCWRSTFNWKVHINMIGYNQIAPKMFITSVWNCIRVKFDVFLLFFGIHRIFQVSVAICSKMFCHKGCKWCYWNGYCGSFFNLLSKWKCCQTPDLSQLFASSSTSGPVGCKKQFCLWS